MKASQNHVVNFRNFSDPLICCLMWRWLYSPLCPHRGLHKIPQKLLIHIPSGPLHLWRCIFGFYKYTLRTWNSGAILHQFHMQLCKQVQKKLHSTITQLCRRSSCARCCIKQWCFPPPHPFIVFHLQFPSFQILVCQVIAQFQDRGQSIYTSIYSQCLCPAGDN